MKQKFAVFDIDGTVYRSSLFFDMMEEIYEQGILPEKYAKAYRAKTRQWIERSHAEAYRERLEESLLHIGPLVQNITPTQLKSIAQNVVKRDKKKTYVYTLELLKKLKNEGYFLVALSGSLEELVKAFAEHYDFDAYHGSVWHKTADGTAFTGKLKDGTADKDILLKKIIAENDLTNTDSIAVGDTESDIPMLEAVENPIAFNPEEKLYKHARKKGWNIVVERKNVVYTLKSDKSIHFLV